MQSREDPPKGFLRVDEGEDGVAQIHRLARLGVHVVEGLERFDAIVDEGQQPLVGDIPPELEFRHRLDAAGGAGVADHEDGVAAAHSGFAPAEEVVAGVQRVVVFIDPQEAEVEGVARVGEVVRVSAEVSDGEFGRHHQAHIGVAPEDVGRVTPTVVERDHLDFDAGVLTPELLGDARRDLLFGCGAGLRAGLRFVDALQGGVHFTGHVADGDEPVGLEVLDGALIGEGCRVEAIVQKALAVEGHGGDMLPRAVMVGQHKPVGGNEGGRAAGDAQRSQPGAAEPHGIRCDAVRLLQVVDGRILEGPHAPVVEATGSHRVEAGDGGLRLRSSRSGGECGGFRRHHRLPLHARGIGGHLRHGPGTTTARERHQARQGVADSNSQGSRLAKRNCEPRPSTFLRAADSIERVPTRLREECCLPGQRPGCRGFRRSGRGR